MHKDIYNRLYKLIYDLNVIWHDKLGCCGNYWLGNRGKDLVISFLTYMRTIEVAFDYDWDIKDEWDPIQVTADNDIIYDTLNNAIIGINGINNNKASFSKHIIPELPYFDKKDLKIINAILLEWFEVIDEALLSLDSLSEEDWAEFINTISNKYK